MERIRRNQFDTLDEQVKVVNKVIDNQNQIEGKLLQIIAAAGKPKKAKKGDKNA